MKWLFSLALFLSCINCLLADSENINGITWTYTISNGEASVGSGSSSNTAIPKSTGGTITIPSSLGGCPVTSIGNYAFYDCEQLRELMIPDSVTNIGVSAFWSCSSLEDLMIPDGITEISDDAFKFCYGLTSITLPNSVTSIGRYAFAYCLGLTSVTIPDEVRSIAECSFYNCTGMTNVAMSRSVTNIGDRAFYNCTGLTCVEIPASVTSIGSRAFSGCYNLASFNVDEQNSEYSSANGCLLSKDGKQLIAGVAGDVTIPDGVTSIGDQAFYGMGHYEAIDLQHGIVNKYGLMKVTIPSSVTNIGYQAFYNCTQLAALMIPDGVLTLGDQSFYNCGCLTNVTISSSVTSIGDMAFWSCFSLEEVTIPSGVRSIGDGAFSMCTILDSITIKSCELKIGASAFNRCTHLRSVYLPIEYTGSTSEFPTGAEIIRYKSIQTVYLNAAGGQVSPPSILARWMSAYGPLPVPSRDGHYFVEWTYGGKAILDDTIVSAFDDHTLVARWCPFQCTITFNANGGSGGKTVTQDYGTKLYAPTVTREGYTFAGWSPSVPATVPASNATYTAQWQINQYTIRFNANGGLGSRMITRDYGTNLSAPTVEREGYTFMGWSPVVPATVPASNATYTAQWQANQYEMTFNADGGTGGVTINMDCGTTLSAPTVIREGYTFTGWLPAVPATVPASNATYVAQWRINQYNVTFDANGGTGGCEMIQDYGTSLVAPAVTRLGHTFTGWSPAVSATVPAANMTYTAQWQINQYNVTFDANGGTGGKTVKQDYGTTIVAPTVTRLGYTFTGWLPAVPATVPADNTTYVAQWRINQYNITFNANGGTGGKTVTQDCGTTLAAPAVTRTGYTFVCWSPSVPSTVPAENATYTAQWRVNQYMVIFDANGGIGGSSGKQDYGSPIIVPTVTREWFNFMGWSPSVAVTVPANDVTYTAQWSRYGAEFTASQVAGKKLRELYPDDYANLTTIVLKDGISELPEGFFDGCDKVEFVTWPSTLLEFGIDDLPSKIRATLAYDENGFMLYNGWILDYQNRNVAAVTIPEGIVGIGRGAFSAMFDLETVTMPESLKCIAKGAFEDCSWIQDLQFMSGLRYVGPFAFRGCSSLLRATFADGVENLGTNVFESCWRMQSVRLPFTVTNIGVNAFTGCSAIRGVTVPTQVETMQTLFPVAYTKIETAEVAEGETAVMNDMFKGCTALRGGATQTDMSMIPNTVTNIGARAFQGCTSLTAFVVPDSVTEIGEAVFLGCTSLWNVTLSRNLEAIPDKAFYGCTMLETMVVPQNVNYLGNQFFCGKDNGANALYYLCTNAPTCHASAYSAITGNMTTYVEQGSRSWDGRQGSRVLPQSWNGYPITYWTPNRFDVTFDANGGRFELVDGSAYAWSEQQITDTGYALPSTEPIRPGWAFEGWWTEQYGGAEVRYTTLVTATRTHMLYAHWRLLGEGMTVTFNSNGGTVVVPGSQDYVPGQTFGQFPVPTRRGYAFQGWWTESVDGVHMTEATQVPAADMELFAHWSPITYVVRFHANGGKGGDVDQTFEFDVQKALASHTFTRTGFAFSGWATTPSGQVRYAENASVVNLEEVQDKVVDLYAVWSGVGYSVRFDSNGGNGIMDNQTIAVDETQNLWPNVFARGGYNFAGWALSPTDAANGTVKYRDGAAVRNLATSNGAVVPLYAVWFSSDQTVRISFDANGGSVSPDYWDCLMGTAVEAFPTATRPGFTFSGWWTAKTGGMEVESIAVVSDARTFYAHWAENGEVNPGDWSCTVSFNANGGSVTETSRIVGSGATVGMLPAPIRMGYSFRGWFTATEEGVEVTAATVVTGSVTYYAHWAINRYTVTFNANGGEGEMLDQMMIYGELAPLEAVAFAKSGSRFIGWAVEPEGGVVYHDGQSVQDLSADADGVVVLYAVWEECELTLADVLCNDARGVGFSVDSETDWTIDFTDGHDAPSARSGEIAAAENGGRTSTTLKATVTGEGMGSFWWKVSCEDMDDEYGEWYDYAMFKVDGIAVAQIAGERDWEQVEFVVSGAGTHTLSWTFTRDDYDEDGATYENAAWVDGVIWTPRPVTVTFAAGGAEEGEAPEAIVKYQGYELALPGAGTLVNGTCRFVGWTDGVATCEAGSTYIVPATNVTLTAVWELKAWTLGEAVDAAALSFVTGGNADWSVSASNGSTNGVAAKSGTVENGEASWIEATIHGGGTLAFHWNVLGGIYRNTPFAYAKVEVDGVQLAQEHNTEGWKVQTVEIDGAGAHTIRWTYLRTSARTVDVGDCAWIDEVVWMPSGGTIPELTPAQAAVWISNDLAARYAKSGESAVDYQSRFEAKFGSDPVAAMSMPTDKKDAQGNDMYVWQDYVAGTDPTDTNSVFTATITMVDGEPVVEWSPKLGAAEESRRRYTIYGKAGLESGEEWHSPTNALDRFFTVGVEMR